MAKITVIRSTTSKAPKGYEIVELAYKTDEGKTKGMKIFNLGDLKDVAEVAKAAQPGDVLDASFKQNDKGFWQFSSLVSTGIKEATISAATPSSATPNRGGWETHEERAARQVMIVRQSSLSTAVALVAAQAPKGTTAVPINIIDYAKEFEAYVLGKPQQTGDVE